MSFSTPKPVCPPLVSPEDTSRIFKHRGENIESFNFTASLLSKFMNFFKMVPTFESEGYQYGAESTYTEEGAGNYDNIDTDKRGHRYKFLVNDEFEERYGDWHRLGKSVGSYWGYEKVYGKKASNLNYEPSAGTSDFFTDGAYVGEEDRPVDLDDYLNLLYYDYYNTNDAAGDDVDYSETFGEITSEEWNGAKNYLSQYGDLNFYDIVLKGIDAVDLPGRAASAPDDAGTNPQQLDWAKVDWDTVNSAYFQYDDKLSHNGRRGLGAYYMMIGLLDNFRKINSAYAFLYGSHLNIANNNSVAMREHFDSVYDEYLKGADEHNLQIFQLFLQQPAHSLRSLYGAFRGGIENGGDAGYLDPDTNEWTGHMYSARDMVAFKRFRDTIIPEAQAYIDSISDGTEKARAQALLDEFTFDLADDDGDPVSQPWGADARSYTDGEDKGSLWTGWDYFGNHFWKGPGATDKTADQIYYEWGYNPWIIEKDSGWHAGYVFSQTLGLTQNQIKGKFAVKDGIRYDLSDNWVINAISTFSTKIDARRVSEAFGANLARQMMYKQALRRYNRKKAEKKEEKIEKALDEKIFNKKQAQRKAAEKKSLQKAGSRGKKRTKISGSKNNRMRMKNNRVGGKETARMLSQTNYKLMMNRLAKKRNKPKKQQV